MNDQKHEAHLLSANGLPILCLDFDGVIHSYKSTWTNAADVADPMTPGTCEFLEEAVKYFSVHVFSVRSNCIGGVVAMQRYIYGNLVGTFGHEKGREISDKIQYPDVKPPAHVFLDDHGMTFTGVWPSIEVLKAFKPWNR